MIPNLEADMCQAKSISKSMNIRKVRRELVKNILTKHAERLTKVDAKAKHVMRLCLELKCELQVDTTNEQLKPTTDEDVTVKLIKNALQVAQANFVSKQVEVEDDDRDSKWTSG